MKREQQIEHAVEIEEIIEEIIDDIIEIVLNDSRVRHYGTQDGHPVSPETWLEVKAKIYALLSLDEVDHE